MHFFHSTWACKHINKLLLRTAVKEIYNLHSMFVLGEHEDFNEQHALICVISHPIQSRFEINNLKI